MPQMTKLQRKLIQDIERNLNVIYVDQNTRKHANIFIKKYIDENRKFRQEHHKITLPTGKQLRFIKNIEKELHVKFRGRTFESANLFIVENREGYILTRNNWL